MARSQPGRRKPGPVREAFTTFARRVASVAGSPWAFLLALGVVVTWAVTGPLFGFSDTWQLVINTGTTIVTFLMVFLIQHDQNRDTKVLQLKLDELVAAHKGASNHLIDLEDLSEAEIQDLERRFRILAERTKGRKNGATSVEDVRRADEGAPKGASRGRRHGPPG
jgi:low affinity Fe/Cu permease